MRNLEEPSEVEVNVMTIMSAEASHCTIESRFP